jgi:DNA-binding FadR family transcriptional regulator
MLRDRSRRAIFSDFLNYLVENQKEERIPTLAELSQQLGVGIAGLREQLEVARVLGMVEVRPKTGIKRLPFTFSPAVRQCAQYAVEIDPAMFQAFLDLRDHIEAAYWHQAVAHLNTEDHENLRSLVRRAKEKMNGQPTQIPHYEHRELHLMIYRKLNNPFVIGILEAFWDLYETNGLDIYGDINYLEQVWNYHEKMVLYLCSGEVDAAYQIMVEHKGFLNSRAKPRKQQFE